MTSTKDRWAPFRGQLVARLSPPWPLPRRPEGSEAAIVRRFQPSTYNYSLDGTNWQMATKTTTATKTQTKQLSLSLGWTSATRGEIMPCSKSTTGSHRRPPNLIVTSNSNSRDVIVIYAGNTLTSWSAAQTLSSTAWMWLSSYPNRSWSTTAINKLPLTRVIPWTAA